MSEISLFGGVRESELVNVRSPAKDASSPSTQRRHSACGSPQDAMQLFLASSTRPLHKELRFSLPHSESVSNLRCGFHTIHRPVLLFTPICEVPEGAGW
eukprot:3167480-Amphidinium_carterae.1